MQGFPIELLVYGGIFLMILLFNLFARQRAAQQAPPAQDPEQEALPPDAQEEPLEPSAEFWGRVDPARAALAIAPAPAAHHPPARPRAAPARRLQRYTRQTLFGSKREARKAIVLMTVLGPPRGAEPPPRQEAGLPGRR